MTSWRHADTANPILEAERMRSRVTAAHRPAYGKRMAGSHAFGGQGLSDALTILGAAGIVIPAFARLKISPVIGFIIVGVIAGPFGLGGYTDTYPWLQAITINDPEAIE